MKKLFFMTLICFQANAYSYLICESSMEVGDFFTHCEFKKTEDSSVLKVDCEKFVKMGNNKCLTKKLTHQELNFIFCGGETLGGFSPTWEYK